MKRTLVVLALAAAGLAAGGVAPKTHECDGLDVCVSVPGPWVVVPAPASSGERIPTYYQLRCPRHGMVVGGLDAELSDRSLRLEFLGKLGSPVNPGISTSSAVVFAATYTGAQLRPTSFRPLIGCMPSSGGGRGTTSIDSKATAPRPQPPLRRVRTVRLGTASSRVLSHGCRRGERLLSSSAALGFRQKAPPTDDLMASVRLSRSTQGNRVIVTVRLGRPLPSTVRAEVQVHAVCARS